ncbi:nitronate monooxygenase [Streptomyces sp. NPDC003077]|uniref:NAD(P)H-dependent flavin oxidoreductase n=1 Tax=Streptomyces sp. NPDC003077 TaxID=3154443 RepID=UPI0033A203AD
MSPPPERTPGYGAGTGAERGGRAAGPVPKGGSQPAPTGHALERALGLDLPLLQAGMGGVAGPDLCAAVSRAGAGGTLALYKEPPDRIRELVAAVATATTRPFGVNLVPEVTDPATCRAQLRAALERLPDHGFVTFFGLPPPEAARTVVRTGHPLVIQIGSVQDAGRALRLGAGVLVLQGMEAGGHLLGAMTGPQLLREVRARHPRAVLAVAGGIATGADLAAARRRGADGAVAGTLFVPTDESDAHPLFKRRVVEASARDTVVTGLYDIGWPDRPHRVLRNALTADATRRPAVFIASARVGARRVPVPRYSAAAPSAGTEGRIEEMAMYCGRSCAGVTGRHPVASVVERFRREYEAAEPPRDRFAEGEAWTTRSSR